MSMIGYQGPPSKKSRTVSGRSFRSRSRERTSHRVFPEILIKEPEDDCYRKYIHSDEWICSHCQNSFDLTFHPDGSTEILGNHLPNCEAFNLAENKVESNFDIKGDSLYIGDCIYKSFSGSESTEMYLCMHCLGNRNIVEAKIVTYAVEIGKHCESCKSSKRTTNQREGDTSDGITADIQSRSSTLSHDETPTSETRASSIPPSANHYHRNSNYQIRSRSATPSPSPHNELIISEFRTRSIVPSDGQYNNSNNQTQSCAVSMEKIPPLRIRCPSRAPSIGPGTKKPIPKDRYSLEKIKDESKISAVLIIEEDDPDKAREFPFRKFKHNGNSMSFHCPYCNKTFLEYNKSENNLYWLVEENNHVADYDCSSMPLTVLKEKYDRIRRGIAVSAGWWKKKSREYKFPLPLRYAAAHKARQESASNYK